MTYAKFQGTDADGYGTNAAVTDSTTTLLLADVSSEESQDDDAQEKHCFLFFDLDSAGDLLDGGLPPANAVITQLKVGVYVTATSPDNVPRANLFVADNLIGDSLETSDYELVQAGGENMGYWSMSVGAHTKTSTTQAVLDEVKSALTAGHTLNFEIDASWGGAITDLSSATFGSRTNATVAYRPYIEIWWGFAGGVRNATIRNATIRNAK